MQTNYVGCNIRTVRVPHVPYIVQYASRSLLFDTDVFLPRRDVSDSVLAFLIVFFIYFRFVNVISVCVRNTGSGRAAADSSGAAGGKVCKPKLGYKGSI